MSALHSTHSFTTFTLLKYAAKPRGVWSSPCLASVSALSLNNSVATLALFFNVIVLHCILMYYGKEVLSWIYHQYYIICLQ